MTTGWTLEQIREMPAPDVQKLRRFYRRHPFGPVRGDLQMWLAARNVQEAVFGRLRAIDRSPLGVSKHPPVRAGKVKTRVTRDALEALSKELGVPFTPGPGG